MQISTWNYFNLDIYSPGGGGGGKLPYETDGDARQKFWI